MLKLVFITIGLLVLVNGHGWMNYPVPRAYAGDNQGSASKTFPCGNGTPGTYTNYYTLQNNGTLNVQWDIGGGHTGTTGPNTCQFLYSSSDTAANWTQLSTTFDCTPSGEHSQVIPINIPNAGSNLYYIQFFWYAGDGSMWYNCAPFGIIPANLKVNNLDSTQGNVPSTPVDDNNGVYYSMTVVSGSFVYLTVTGPSAGSINLYEKVGVLPTPSVYDKYVNIPANDVGGVSFCSASNANTTAYLALFADGSATGDYSLQTSTYNSFVNFANNFPQISDSILTGSKFYYAVAYSTEEVPKRIVLLASTAFGLSQSTSCTSKPNPDIMVTGSSACLDLTSTTNTKYIEVVNTGSASANFQLGIQTGTCKQLKSGSAQVQASFALFALLAVLLLIL